MSASTAPALALFDIDGTLIRRAGPHHRQALVEAIRRVTGLATTTDGIPLYGMLDPDIIREMLRQAGAAARATPCRVRLRPVLMTSLATIIGLLPMALKLGAGSEAYAPLARAILGGLSVSVALTVFLVPAAYALVYAPREAR